MRLHAAFIVAALATPVLAQDPVAPVGSGDHTVMVESVTDALDFDHAKKHAHEVAGDPTVDLAKTLPASHAQAVAAQVQASYGVRPRRWLGYLDTPNGNGQALAKAVENAAALTNGKISPTWLYAIAIGEGMSYWTQQGGPVSGFQELGVDNFGTRAAALKKEGYLPQSFTLGRDYTLDKNMNEKGETVTSANFPNVNAALVALQAMLQESRARAIATAKEVYGPNVQLSEDDIRFWTYFDFNCGAARAKDFMQNHPSTWGRHRTGPERTDQREGHYNGVVRVATAKWLEELGAFPKPATHVHQLNIPLGGSSSP